MVYGYNQRNVSFQMLNIASLKITGSGEIILMDTIRMENLKLNISGSRKIEGRIEN